MVDELTPPVKVDEVLENQEVISLGKKGEGVLKYEGYILFVAGANKGDIINCKVTKVLPKFGIAMKID